MRSIARPIPSCTAPRRGQGPSEAACGWGCPIAWLGLRREAQILAALNHPNIATIHGFDRSPRRHARAVHSRARRGGRRLPSVPGGAPASLSDARRHGGAGQIAQSLKAAHERGIIHRDLKPANIKLRSDGVVKLLDFGVAKLQPADSLNAVRADVSTASAPGNTHEGVIVGTLAYMSPEQVRGDDVDERTDVWAFGCVLFVLLSGREPFSGRTPSDTIATILGQEPDWSMLPADTPAPVRRILRRCLHKDRRSRLRDLGEALADLDEVVTPAAAGLNDSPNAGARRSISGRAVVFAALITAAMVVVAFRWARISDVSTAAIRFPIAVPSGFHVTSALPAVSPDGRTIIFSACSRCDTEDLDNRVADRRTISSSGSPSPSRRRAARSSLFSPRTDARSHSAGATDSGEDAGRRRHTHRAVPGADCRGGLGTGRHHCLFIDGGTDARLRIRRHTTTTHESEGWQDARLAGRPAGRWRRVVHRVGRPAAHGDGPDRDSGRSTAEWSEPYREGAILESLVRHVVFARDRSSWAAPFDERGLTITGEAVPVSESPAMSRYSAWPPPPPAAMAHSRRHGADKPKPASRMLEWVTRDRRVEPLNLAPAAYGWPRVAPNGAHIALDIVGTDDVSDIWTYDIAGAGGSAN